MENGKEVARVPCTPEELMEKPSVSDMRAVPDSAGGACCRQCGSAAKRSLIAWSSIDAATDPRGAEKPAPLPLIPKVHLQTRARRCGITLAVSASWTGRAS